MELKLNQNILIYRKQMNLTQEQLADAMGVTIGAVSKWENGLSNPDIGLIAELADFFEISVDVLLGYNWQKRSMGQVVEQIKMLNKEKRFEEAKIEASKALQKYPNSFEVVYYSGVMYENMGMETHNKEVLLLSLNLMNRACDLIVQNTNPKISYETIQIKIGIIYALTGDFDKAIEHLKKHNIEGVCNSSIGQFLVHQQKYDEAIPILSENNMDCVVKLFRGSISMVNAYGNQKRYKETQELLKWLNNIFLGLLDEEKGGYILKILSIIAILQSIVYACDSRMEESYEFFDEAVKYAKRFDDNPNYSTNNFRFYEGKEYTLYDDIGTSTMDMIENIIVTGMEDEPSQEILLQYLKKMYKGEIENGKEE